ncbi:MAG: M14 family metallocarboxypeptidase [Defluviitaleaceae bacterium]|nr:M14 family metallocarboxypeptidase [Defluviitaleaceae bacterium]
MTSKKLAKKISEIKSPFVNHVTFGTSRLGRPLHALTAGYGKKQILINAAHHANEWITTLILMKFLEELTEEPENVTLHIIPLVNPDGADLLTGGLGRLRIACREAAAMCRPEDGVFPDCWKANICGVDLNSNYPAGWELAKKHKFARGYSAPGPRDFVGPSPLSEPETCAMVAYTMANDIDVTISLHSQGEEIYHQYLDFNPPGADELALRFADASGYALTHVPEESSHGGYRDWFISTFNRPGFTIECGAGENPLPLSQFDSIYKKVSALLRTVL